jgi:hypothetical protein
MLSILRFFDPAILVFRRPKNLTPGTPQFPRHLNLSPQHCCAAFAD